MPILLVLFLTLTAASPPLQVPDTTRAARPPVETGFEVLLNPIWSKTAGFGLGAAVHVKHLVAPGTELRLVARPNQHLGRYGVTFRTAAPYRAPYYGLVNVFYETLGRQWYHGLGPSAAEGSVLAVEHERREVEVRLGTTFAAHRFFVEPRLRYAQYRTEGYREWEDGSLAALDARSRANLLFAAGDPASGVPGARAAQEGLWYGLGAGFDSRDNPIRPAHGLILQAGYERFTPTDALDIRLDRALAAFYAFVPMGRLIPFGAGGQVLALRVVAEQTYDRGDAPIPFYLLPSLNGRLVPGYTLDRFFGNDLLALSLEYRMLLFNAFNLVGVEALVSVHAASVYDDLFADFTPRVAFDAPAPGAEDAPLRPAVALGGRLVSLFEDRVYVQGSVGLSPEGFGAVAAGFVYDLRQLDWTKQ